MSDFSYAIFGAVIPGFYLRPHGWWEYSIADGSEVIIRHQLKELSQASNRHLTNCLQLRDQRRVNLARINTEYYSLHLSNFFIDFITFDMADPSTVHGACHIEPSKFALSYHESPSSSVVRASDLHKEGRGFESRRRLRFVACPTLVRYWIFYLSHEKNLLTCISDPRHKVGAQDAGKPERWSIYIITQQWSLERRVYQQIHRFRLEPQRTSTYPTPVGNGFARDNCPPASLVKLRHLPLLWVSYRFGCILEKRLLP